MHNPKHIVNSDILVVGGGGAAVMSSVTAARLGADVVLCAKGKVGKSGNTIMIGGGFSLDAQGVRSCGYEQANPAITKEQLFDKLVTSSFYIGNQRIAKLYVENGGEAVRECLEWSKSTGHPFLFIPGGNSFMSSGRYFGAAVKKGLESAPQIRTYEDTVITHLLLSGGRVCGAVGLNVYTGEVTQYNAGAVILATGGYQPFSLKNSISDMTGDGIALALHAGAAAVDMEFFLYLPTIVQPGFARGSIIPYLVTMPNFGTPEPRVTDLDGVPLPISEECSHLPKANKINKIVYSYFWGKGVFEKYEHYGNAMYYDYSAYSDAEIYAMFENMAKSTSIWHAKGYYNGIYLKKLADHIVHNGKRLKVGFGNEYSMGGIAVDEELSTGVPGLFAAGEVTGGTFGAFRSGDGLVEMLAHGVIAGKSAATFAGKVQQGQAENVDEALDELFAPFAVNDGISPARIHRELESAADEGFNFFRSEERLVTAKERIGSIRASLGRLGISNPSKHYNLEWYDSITARNLALCTEIGINAAFGRKESRGCHMRLDYPAIDNEHYLVNTYARLRGNTILYEAKEPEAPYIPLDKRSYASIPEYIIKKYGGKAVENFNFKK